jgi:hypothetical protein
MLPVEMELSDEAYSNQLKMVGNVKEILQDPAILSHALLTANGVTGVHAMLPAEMEISIGA